LRMGTTTYAIVASMQVFLLYALWTPSGMIWWRAEGIVLWVITGLYIGAWLLLLKAIWDAGVGLQTGFLGWWAIVNELAYNAVIGAMAFRLAIRIGVRPVAVRARPEAAISSKSSRTVTIKALSSSPARFLSIGGTI